MVFVLKLKKYWQPMASNITEYFNVVLKYFNRISPTSRAQNVYLNSFVSLVHELEQLVNDRLEEPPVGSQEPRVLSDDVHDV